MAESSKIPRARRIAFIAVSLAASLFVSLVLFEVGARIIESQRSDRPQRRERLDLLMTNPNGTGSYRLKPDVDLVTRIDRREVRIRTNRHGMHWRDVTIRKNDGRRRIAFLGDSFTFGSWAGGYEESFVGTFDKSVSPERWEVLNFGVGGYGLADEELLLREQVLEFSPSYVIVVVFAGNDFRDTYLGIDKESIIDGAAELQDTKVRAVVPAELLVDDTTVSAPCALAPGPRRWLEGLSSFRLMSPWLGIENLCIEFAVNRNFTMYTFWSQYPYPDTALAAKDAVVETLTRMDSLLEEHRAHLAIVTLPTSEQVHARTETGVDYDIGFPQAYLQVFARDQDIPYLDLLPILRSHVRGTNERLFLAGDPHLNNRGHEIVGEHIADWFRCCVRNRKRLSKESRTRVTVPNDES